MIGGINHPPRKLNLRWTGKRYKTQYQKHTHQHPRFLISFPYFLGDDNRSFHARTAVRFAVVPVGTCDGKLHRVFVTLSSELLVLGDFFRVNTFRDGVFVKDGVVRAALVAGPTSK